MNKPDKIIWGSVFVIVSILLFLNVFGLKLNLLFPGWWTFLIIIPSVIGIIKDSDKLPSIICFIIGVLLLLCCLEILDFKLLTKLVLPIVLLVIGIKLIFGGLMNKPSHEEIKINNRNRKKTEYNSNFSSMFFEQSDALDYSEIETIFGSINVDFKKCDVLEDAIIEADAVFGSIKLRLPEDVKVIIKSSSIFGTINNSRIEKEKTTREVVIYVNSIFGNVNIE